MSTGELPELDVNRIQAWCRQRVPERVRHQVRVECEVTGHQVTVVERRVPWDEDASADWTRRPVARLSYDPLTRQWTLSTRDRNGRFQRYRRLVPTATVGDLLAELDNDPTGAFWG